MFLAICSVAWGQCLGLFGSQFTHLESGHIVPCLLTSTGVVLDIQHDAWHLGGAPQCLC